ncbi:WYL domain-containing protein [Pannonibacter phragmitetus]|uniref:helix-turn-helix transcriptional regulator n=1 Tax=Pannonibacter phragmitetus TaxID=121719 RepID=UPI000A8DE234
MIDTIMTRENSDPKLKILQNERKMDKATRRDAQLGWIEACLRYGGEFGVADKVVYGQLFGLSESSISRHQAEFENLFEAACGSVLKRDESDRVSGGRLSLSENVRLPKEPVFSRMPSFHRWLQESLGSSRYLELPPLRRDPEPWIMRAVIKAIRKRIPLHITYHSRSGSSDRLVSPYALVHIVGRTHMRALDHSKNEPRDFVLSRITDASIHSEEGAHVGPEKDEGWNSLQKITISEKRETDNTSESIGVRLDFGLDEKGQRTITVKKAIAQYLVDDFKDGYAPPVTITLSK